MRLRWSRPDGEAGEMTVHKHVVTVGSAPSNDVATTADGLAEHHAHLLVRGNRVQLGSLGDHSITVNGRKGKLFTVRPGDRIQLGSLSLQILAGDSGTASAPDGPASSPVDTLDRLVWFSERLTEVPHPGQLLDTLLDLLLTVLGAERGLVVVGESQASRVVAARGVDPERTQEELRRLPDGLIRRVRETRRPVASLEVQSDQALAMSTSVVQLGLRAVMALPLAVAGHVKGVLLLASSKTGKSFSTAGLREAGLFSLQASLLLDRVLELEEMRTELVETRRALDDMCEGDLLAASPAMAEVLEVARKVAAADLSVLICGATGTGKEIIARKIHRLSPRRDGPFVALNCGAIPEGLIESELFGHVKGAFSGAASDRRGHVEAASGGTLFLDEIGEMPPVVQVRLLRTLQDRKVTRVGESCARPVDFRLLAATHRDLAAEITAGRFREDLYYRIHEVELTVPPLRERPEDVLLLATHFLRRYAGQYARGSRSLSAAAQEALLTHEWPGNVRELEGRIKRAVVMSDGDAIEPSHLDLTASIPAPVASLEGAVREFRAKMVARALAVHGGSRKKAADALGVDPRTIHRYLTREDE